MISEEAWNDRIFKALTYLSETDEECARLLGYYESLKDQKNTIWGECYSVATEGTVEDKKAATYRHPTYKDHLNRIGEARIEYETIKLKRATQDRVIDVWRSLNANRRVGNI